MTILQRITRKLTRRSHGDTSAGQPQPDMPETPVAQPQARRTEGRRSDRRRNVSHPRPTLSRLQSVSNELQEVGARSWWHWRHHFLQAAALDLQRRTGRTLETSAALMDDQFDDGGFQPHPTSAPAEHVTHPALGEAEAPLTIIGIVAADREQVTPSPRILPPATTPLNHPTDDADMYQPYTGVYNHDEEDLDLLGHHPHAGFSYGEDGRANEPAYGD